jgi:hypothetical protein
MTDRGWLSICFVIIMALGVALIVFANRTTRSSAPTADQCKTVCYPFKADSIDDDVGCYCDMTKAVPQND